MAAVQMTSQTENIPLGETKVATLKITDAAGVDITGMGTVNVTSSNPAVVTVTPQTIQLGAQTIITGYAIKAVAAGTANVTWLWASPSGSISETDIVNATSDPPVAMTITYGTSA